LSLSLYRFNNCYTLHYYNILIDALKQNESNLARWNNSHTALLPIVLNVPALCYDLSASLLFSSLLFSSLLFSSHAPNLNNLIYGIEEQQIYEHLGVPFVRQVIRVCYESPRVVAVVAAVVAVVLLVEWKERRKKLIRILLLWSDFYDSNLQ